MKRERERKTNDNKFKTRSAGGEKGSEKTNKTKQTASRHAFLRGITVNDALLFPLSLPRAADSAPIYDVECAPAIFIKRVRLTLDRRRHRCRDTNGIERGGEKSRRRGSEGTVMWHPAVKLSSAGHITIYEAFLLSPFFPSSSSPLLAGPSDSHFREKPLQKSQVVSTSCFGVYFFFFFYLECCARNCHFGGSLFGVMYLIFF